MTRIYTGEDAERRLSELGLERTKLEVALRLASGEARLCTRFDSPAQAAITFWSRCNRFVREEYVPRGWRYSNAQSVLRTFHPSMDFCFTAMSGSGGVGDPRSKKVRAKNPKGGVVRATVEHNRQLALVLDLPNETVPEEEVEAGILTRTLLYDWDADGISWELSWPVGLQGNYVAEWRERIIPGKLAWDGEPLAFGPDESDDVARFDADFDVEFTG